MIWVGLAVTTVVVFAGTLVADRCLPEGSPWVTLAGVSLAVALRSAWLWWVGA